MFGAAALVFLAACALLLAAGRDRRRQAWALVVLAGTALYFALRDAPLVIPGARWLGSYWNWSGHVLALGGILALALLLIRRAGLTARQLGFAPPAALGTAAAVTTIALVLNYAVNTATGAGLGTIAPETWLFLATMPGLAEEITFRGVLLAAAERAAPRARVIAGAPISAGALLLTLAFFALHGVTAGSLLSVLPAALLYLWLRARTGSVLVPIVAHNAWNLTVLAAHL